jgi:beta-carotene 3-hydroxylase
MNDLGFKVLAMLAAFASMEAVAWFTHKYIMHGVLWVLHKSHHSERKGWFELNDLFSVFFALVAIVFIQIGFRELNYFFWIGLGITLYGFAYFIFHDVIVHRRVKIKYVAKSDYMKGIIRAHKIHHKTTEKERGKSFGFLYTLKKYRES